jgi:hypothetical protein
MDVDFLCPISTWLDATIVPVVNQAIAAERTQMRGETSSKPLVAVRIGDENANHLRSPADPCTGAATPQVGTQSDTTSDDRGNGFQRPRHPTPGLARARRSRSAATPRWPRPAPSLSGRSVEPWGAEARPPRLNHPICSRFLFVHPAGVRSSARWSETPASAAFCEISVANSSQGKHPRSARTPGMQGFLRAERRRSRTCPAWGCQTSPVLKPQRAGHPDQRSMAWA